MVAETSSSPQPSLPKLRRTPWQIQQNVFSALILREVKSRFGSNLSGYGWAVFEPMMQVLIMWGIFTALGRRGIQEIPLPLFLLLGIFSWYMFRKITARLTNSIGPNIGLFSYQPVKVFDVIVVRFWIETIIYLSALAVLLLLFTYLGYDTLIDNPVLLIATYAVFLVFSLSIGIFMLVVSTFYPWSQKLLGLVFRLLFFTSCILFALHDVPTELQKYFILNPLVQFFELLRVAYFANYATHPAIRFENILAVTLVSFYGAMVLYRVNRTRLIQMHLVNKQG